MKRTCTIIAAISAFVAGLENPTLAQTEKGSHIAGTQVGNLVFSRRENLGNAGHLKPTYGFFILDNLAAGLAVPVYYFSGGLPKNSVKLTQLGLSPFVRYYIGSRTVKPFLSVAGGVQRTTYRDLTEVAPPEYDWLYSVGAGAAFFLNKLVSFEIAANYTGARDKDYYSLEGYTQNGLTTSVANAVTINLGFQLYFGRRKEQ